MPMATPMGVTRTKASPKSRYRSVLNLALMYVTPRAKPWSGEDPGESASLIKSQPRIAKHRHESAAETERPAYHPQHFWTKLWWTGRKFTLAAHIHADEVANAPRCPGGT